MTPDETTTPASTLCACGKQCENCGWPNHPTKGYLQQVLTAERARIRAVVEAMRAQMVQKRDDAFGDPELYYQRVAALDDVLAVIDGTQDEVMATWRCECVPFIDPDGNLLGYEYECGCQGGDDAAVLKGKVARMQPVVDVAVKLRGCRAALDHADSQGKSQDFMGQLRERYGLTGRELDRVVDEFGVLDGVMNDYLEARGGRP